MNNSNFNMTVRGHTFEHDYPPTPFNEPIRPLPEAGLKAEPTERTHEELQFLSFFSNSLTLLKIYRVSTQILLLKLKLFQAFKILPSTLEKKSL